MSRISTALLSRLLRSSSIRVLEKCRFVIDRASADADELTLILEHESSVGVATRPYG